MISSELRDWVEGGPWRKTIQSWPHWMKNKKKRLFPLFKEKIDAWHEIAHYIVCEDKDILDPHWGMGDPELSKDILNPVELEVFFVEILISSVDLTQVNDNVAASVIAQMFNPRTNFKNALDVLPLIPALRQKWTKEKAWEELQRKNSLVKNLMSA